MASEYWLNLFTGKTWEEFLKNGAKVTGFREFRKLVVTRIHPGDYFICYLTGISRFIGLLEVLSESYYDKTPIWEDEVFPLRFKVKLIYKLNPKTAIPVLDLKDKLSIFKNIKSSNHWAGFFRGALSKFNKKDAEVIVAVIRKAISNPIKRDFDEQKLRRLPQKSYSKPIKS